MRVARREPARHELRACESQSASLQARVCKSDCRVRVSASQQNKASVNASQHNVRVNEKSNKNTHTSVRLNILTRSDSLLAP